MQYSDKSVWLQLGAGWGKQGTLRGHGSRCRVYLAAPRDRTNRPTAAADNADSATGPPYNAPEAREGAWLRSEWAFSNKEVVLISRQPWHAVFGCSATATVAARSAESRAHQQAPQAGQFGDRSVRSSCGICNAIAIIALQCNIFNEAQYAGTEQGAGRSLGQPA